MASREDTALGGPTGAHATALLAEPADGPARATDAFPAAYSQRPASDEARASLAAVRASRAAAEIRLRRDTHRVRMLTAAILAMCTAGLLGLSHGRKLRRAAAVAAAAAVNQPAAPSPSASPTPLTIDDQTPLVALAPSAPGAPVAAVAVAAAPVPVAAPPAVEALTPEARETALAACRDAYDRHRWRAAAAACGSAFEALPPDPALAMKVAQAQHARSRYAEAGAWAHRAIALDGADPEAFVIVAHAERQAGHWAAANSAYRRYLTLAPRGWHAAEARAAVRAAHAEGRSRA